MAAFNIAKETSLKTSSIITRVVTFLASDMQKLDNLKEASFDHLKMFFLLRSKINLTERWNKKARKVIILSLYVIRMTSLSAVLLSSSHLSFSKLRNVVMKKFFMQIWRLWLEEIALIINGLATEQLVISTKMLEIFCCCFAIQPLQFESNGNKRKR